MTAPAAHRVDSRAEGRVPSARRGTFIVSIDLEFAWGVRHYGPPPAPLRDAIRREHAVVGRVLEAFAKHDVRATWAIVAALLREDAAPDGDLDLWYAPQAIRAITEAAPEQEVGSHSFGHLFFDERTLSREEAEADLREARKVHEAHGLPFRAFVFPRNLVGHRELLAELGVRVYRGPGRRWYSGLPLKPARRLLNLAAFGVGATPATFRPRVDELGMVDVPDSMMLLGRNGMRRFVPPRSLVRMGVAGLERAARRGEVFHLYFHPSNLAYGTDAQIAVLEEILAHAARLRAEGRLDIRTMGEMIENTDTAAGHESRRAREMREKAVTFHDGATARFERKYSEGAADPFASSFAYGRRKLDVLLEDALGDVPRGGRVLDVGCGTGEQLRVLREMGFQVAGLEPAPRMRAIAQAANPGVEVVDGSVLALPFPDASFDFIISIEVLRYLDINDVRRAYAELLRVLKPGGRVFFTMVNLWALDGYRAFYGARKLAARVVGTEAPVPTEFVTPGAVKRDLLAAGASEVRALGAVFAPVRIAYKLNQRLGATVGRALDRFDDAVSRKGWHVPFAGHLVVVARKG